jgi:hypothetical protein
MIIRKEIRNIEYKNRRLGESELPMNGVLKIPHKPKPKMKIPILFFFITPVRSLTMPSVAIPVGNRHEQSL